MEQSGPGITSAAQPADSSGQAGEIIRIELPTRRQGVFDILCELLPLIVIAFLFLPHLTGKYAWGMAAFLAFCFLISVVMPLFVRTQLTLSGEGIRKGKRLVRWDEITSIDKSWFIGRRFFIGYGKARKRLVLLSYPIVFRQVLPELIRRRPDLSVSNRMLRAIERPDEPLMPIWLLNTGFLGMVIGLAIEMIAVHFLPYQWLLLPIIVVFASFFFLLCTVPVGTPKHHLFIQSYLVVLPFLPALAFCFFAFDLPIRALDAVLAMAMVGLVAGAWFLWRGGGLTILRKAAVIACLLIVPAAVYYGQSGDRLGRTDVTALFGNQPAWQPLIWSPDGRLAGKLLAYGKEGQRNFILDMETGRSTPLPQHDGDQFIWALNRNSVLRSSKVGEDRKLLLYTFVDGRETVLSEAGRPSVAMGDGISPDGMRICWLEHPKKDEDKKYESSVPPPVLKIFEISTGQTKVLDVAWPEDTLIDWRPACWTDNERLAAVGYTRVPDNKHDEPKTMYVLEVIPAPGLGLFSGGGSDLNLILHSSEHKYLDYRPAPEPLHAFATGMDGKDDGQVYYIDLREGTTTPLGKGDMPNWQRGGQHAIRVISGADGRRLCRFDIRTRQETNLLTIPNGTDVASYSPSGRFVLLNRKECIVNPLTLVDTKTGRRMRLDVSLMSSLTAMIGSTSDWPPCMSAWTPDERRFFMTCMDMNELKPVCRLSTLPSDWFEDK